VEPPLLMPIGGCERAISEGIRAKRTKRAYFM